MDWYLCVVDVLECNVLTLPLDLVVSLEIVEGRIREVCGNRGSVLLSDGRNEDRITEEELEIDGVCGRVLRENMPEGVQYRCAVEVGLMEGSEEVIQESIPVGDKRGVRANWE